MRPADHIQRCIATVRGARIILDADLARLYGVETRVLLQAVRRNARRFPPDFLFQIENHDVAALRSQTVISNGPGRGGRRYRPYAFTEHGAVMAATVLNSSRAVEMSIYVMRAFVALREAGAAHKEIGRRVDELERKVGTHDHAIAQILDAIRQLAAPPQPRARRRIGFIQS